LVQITPHNRGLSFDSRCSYSRMPREVSKLQESAQDGVCWRSVGRRRHP